MKSYKMFYIVFYDLELHFSFLCNLIVTVMNVIIYDGNIYLRLKTNGLVRKFTITVTDTLHKLNAKL